MALFSGLISVDLDVTVESGGDRRRVSTTLGFPQGRSAAVVEIPAAGPSAVVRVLLLALERH